jgi:secreted trypsin-like serine protease
VDHLQSVSLPIVSFDQCVRKYDEYEIPLRHTQFCAGAQNRDTCRGDSGAPTMRFNPVRQAYEVVGITSIGSTKCGTGIPGVYTRVEAFVDWIYAVLSRDF